MAAIGTLKHYNSQVTLIVMDLKKKNIFITVTRQSDSGWANPCSSWIHRLDWASPAIHRTSDHSANNASHLHFHRQACCHLCRSQLANRYLVSTHLIFPVYSLILSKCLLLEEKLQANLKCILCG